jgi:hypothetical protein
MRRSEILEEAYSLSPLAEGRVRIEKLCAFFDPKNYRGIERYPLNADMPYIEPGWQWTDIKPTDLDEKARNRVREIIGPITWQDEDEWLVSDPWLIPSLDQIAELRRLLSQPEDFETIEIAKLPAHTKSRAIGFDVGYWAQGNFSIICDSLVWPTWHPPPKEIVVELARHASDLNEYVLFSTEDAAQSFRDFYNTQDWSENPDEFEIIEVALIGES